MLVNCMPAQPILFPEINRIPREGIALCRVHEATAALAYPLAAAGLAGRDAGLVGAAFRCKVVGWGRVGVVQWGQTRRF
jgi:hypothetical protein